MVFDYDWPCLFKFGMEGEKKHKMQRERHLKTKTFKGVLSRKTFCLRL